MYAWGAEGNVIEITSPSLELHNVNTELGLFVSYASIYVPHNVSQST